MITVVVPVYNAEKYLDECLGSILAQSYSDFELLLFIGKCTDFSREICEKYKASDTRVQIYDQIKVGPGGARNQGLDIAKGEYIYFCDADDLLTRDCLKTFVSMATIGNHDIVESNAFMLTQKGEGWVTETLGCSFWAITIGHDSVERYANPAVWKYFSRVDLWRDNNIRFADFLTSMDDLATYSLLFRSAKNPLFILNNLYYYRVFAGSLSHTPSRLRGRFQNIFKICEYLSSEFKKRNMFMQSKYTLAGQMEHHGRVALNAIPDLTDEERIMFSQNLAEHIRECFEVQLSVFDCGCFSWGSSLVHALSDRIGHCPLKGNIKIESKSIWGIGNDEIKDVAQSIRECKANLAIIDLINETGNIAEIEDITDHLPEWENKFRLFIEEIKGALERPSQVVIVENYYCLLDNSGSEIKPFDNYKDLEFLNDVLKLYYETARKVIGEENFLPPAPQKIMFSEKGIPTDYNSCIIAYHHNNVMDQIR